MSTEVLNEFARGHEVDEAELDKVITNIARAVVARYFSSYPNKDEFFSIARFKAIALLKAKHCDPNRPLMNFVFTGIRNEITNSLSPTKRVQYVDETEFLEALETRTNRRPEESYSRFTTEFAEALHEKAERIYPLVENRSRFKLELELFLDSFDLDGISSFTAAFIRGVVSLVVFAPGTA